MVQQLKHRFYPIAAWAEENWGIGILVENKDNYIEVAVFLVKIVWGIGYKKG